MIENFWSKKSPRVWAFLLLIWLCITGELLITSSCLVDIVEDTRSNDEEFLSSHCIVRMESLTITRSESVLLSSGKHVFSPVTWYSLNRHTWSFDQHTVCSCPSCFFFRPKHISFSRYYAQPKTCLSDSWDPSAWSVVKIWEVVSIFARW